MYLSLPHITRENPPEGYMEQVKKWLEAGLSGFLVRNLESYSALAQMGLADKCVLDHSLYTWNDEAIRFWKDQGIFRNTVPLELNEKELRHRENAGSEMICLRPSASYAQRPVCTKEYFRLQWTGGEACSERPL